MNSTRWNMFRVISLFIIIIAVAVAVNWPPVLETILENRDDCIQYMKYDDKPKPAAPENTLYPTLLGVLGVVCMLFFAPRIRRMVNQRSFKKPGNVEINNLLAGEDGRFIENDERGKEPKEATRAPEMEEVRGEGKREGSKLKEKIENPSIGPVHRENAVEEAARAFEEEKRLLIEKNDSKINELEEALCLVENTVEEVRGSGKREVSKLKEERETLTTALKKLEGALEEAERTFEEKKAEIVAKKDSELEKSRVQLDKFIRRALEGKTDSRMEASGEPVWRTLAYCGDFGPLLDSVRMGDMTHAIPWPADARPKSPGDPSIDVVMMAGAKIPLHARRLIALDKPVLIVSDNAAERVQAFKALPHVTIAYTTSEEIMNPDLLSGSLKVVTDIDAFTYFKSEIGRLISGNKTIKKHLEKIDKILAYITLERPILITGEPGVGKALFAGYIAAKMGLKTVRVNCGSVSRTLWNSDFFGHAKGSFTDGKGKRSGALHSANGGILFLDEIGELLKLIQAALLTVIEDGEYTRVGEDIPRKTDFKLVAATNRNLDQMVRDRNFRGDFRDRLKKGFQFHIPNIDEREEDIPLITHYLINQLIGETGMHVRCSNAFITALPLLPLEANVRDLISIVHKVFFDAGDGGVLTESAIMRPENETPLLDEAKAAFEKRMIEIALNATGWHRARAGSLLGKSGGFVYKKIKAHELEKTVL